MRVARCRGRLYQGLINHFLQTESRNAGDQGSEHAAEPVDETVAEQAGPHAGSVSRTKNP